MAKLDDWMPTLRSRVSGADDDMLELELKNAVREFSNKSGAFLRQVGPYDIKSGKTIYRIQSQPNGTVLWVHAVLRTDDNETPYPIVQSTGFTNLRTQADHFTLESPGVLKLSYTPEADVEDAFTVWVGLEPNLSASTVQLPDEYSNLWFDHLLDGALGRLHSMHKRPWSNLVTAQYHMKRFKNGINEARDVTRRRFSNAEDSPQFPSWGQLRVNKSRW